MPHVNKQTQDQVEAKIRWTKYIDPTDGGDIAFGTCVLGDYIAVVGAVRVTHDEKNEILSSRPYVALLRKSDGTIVKEWIGNELGFFFNCISIDGKLYAFGFTIDLVKARKARDYFGPIYVFDAGLNIIAKITGEDFVAYSSLAYDGRSLYIGGFGDEDVDRDGKKENVWLVEKRDPVSLSLIASKKIYLSSWKGGAIEDIGVDPSTGNIWAVGYYKDYSKKSHSLIVVLDGSLRVLKVIDYPVGSEGYLDWLYGIAFDGRQYAYIVGDNGVAKFSLDGKLVAINRNISAMTKIVYGHGYLYTFGEEKIRDYWRHVLYIHDTNLNIVKSYVLSEGVNANSFFHHGRPAPEGSNIYVAGYDEALGDDSPRIVVYSLTLEGATVKTVDKDVRIEPGEGKHSLRTLLQELYKQSATP